MSAILTEKTGDLVQWFAYHDPPPPPLANRMLFAERGLRNLVTIGMAALEEVEALRGRQGWPMSQELLQKLDESVQTFIRDRAQPFGDPDRKMDFLLDMLRQVLDLHVLLVKELEAVQKGYGGQLWTPDSLPGRMM